MSPDIWSLYRHMLRSRRFEEAVADLWHKGLIAAEMHLGTGEEAVAAGVVSQFMDGDALALDHRGTPPLAVRGVDLTLLLKEFLGHPDGLCGGQGGHMHLFAPEQLAASSGIVGAAGPAAAGLALANRHLRPGRIAAAFLGEGAMNQGMMLESLNLAAAWTLPVIFVCRDNDRAISTRSSDVTGGSLADRARSFGLPVLEVDGADAEAVWHAAHTAISRARSGGGPSFLLAHCAHLDGHFLGDPLIEAVRNPASLLPTLRALLRGLFARNGASLRVRLAALRGVIWTLLDTRRDMKQHRERDPIPRLRARLTGNPARLFALEQAVRDEIEQVVAQALDLTQPEVIG